MVLLDDHLIKSVAAVWAAAVTALVGFPFDNELEHGNPARKGSVKQPEAGGMTVVFAGDERTSRTGPGKMVASRS